MALALRSDFIVFICLALVLSSPVMALEVDQDLPPVYEIEFEYTSLRVDITGNDTTIGEYPGIVTTNYPGLTIEVYIDAYVGNYTTTVIPANMTLTGRAQEDFVIRVVVPGGEANNTTLVGRYHISVIITFPGMSETALSSGSLALGVINREYKGPESPHADPSTVRAPGLNDYPGPDTDTLPLIYIALISLSVILSSYYIYRRRKELKKRGPSKRKKTRSKKRKKRSKR
jgi:hypothetical protein